MKKILSLALILMLALSTVPAGLAEAPAEELTDITVYCMFSNVTPAEGNPVQTYIEEKFGIRFLCEMLPIGEQTNKINMWLASGDAPGDVVRMATSYDNIWKLGRAGYIIETEALAQQYPAVSDGWDSDLVDVLWRDPESQKLYCIPGCGFKAEDMVVTDVGPIIRQDLLDAAGVEPPTDLDSLYTVLKAFNDLGEHNGIDIQPLGNSDYMYYFRGVFGLEVDFENRTFFNINKDAYSHYWLYMNRLYREGLLDPEYFVLTSEQRQSKQSSGAIGMTMGYWYTLDTINNALAATDPNAKFVGTQWITGPDGFTPTRQDARNGWYHHQVAISSSFAQDEAKLQKFMEYFSWNFGEEGSFVTKYGPENLYFEEGEDGIFRPNEACLQLQAQPDNAWQIQSGIWAYDIANMKEMDYKVLQFSDTVADACYDTWWQNFNWERYNLVKWTLAQTQYKNANGLEADEHGTNYPYLYTTDLDEQYDKYEANAIMAESEEDCKRLIDEYAAYVESCGILEQAEAYFTIYDEFMANK